MSLGHWQLDGYAFAAYLASWQRDTLQHTSMGWMRGELTMIAAKRSDKQHDGRIIVLSQLAVLRMTAVLGIGGREMVLTLTLTWILPGLLLGCPKSNSRFYLTLKLWNLLCLLKFILWCCTKKIQKVLSIQQNKQRRNRILKNCIPRNIKR